MSSFMILALAGSALAVPFAGEHGHAAPHRQMHEQHQHHHWFASGVPSATGTGAPFALSNSTGIYPPAGTAASTGLPIPSAQALAVAAAAAAAASGSDSGSGSSSSSCSQSTVEVTSTRLLTMTVTRSGSTAISTVEAASIEPREAWDGAQHRYRKSTSTTVQAVAATTTAQAVSSVAAAVSSVVSSAAAAVSSTVSSVVSSSGKRGLAYNDASLTTPFVGSSQVSWGYNWGQTSSGLSSTLNFVPLLWGTSSTFTSGWAATVAAAASSGVTHLMSFNEPDLSSQANISPADAATAFKQYMQPYAGQFKLGSPAVTNGGGAMGLDWLDAFLTACDDCTIDFVPIHWYDSPANTAYFEEHVTNASTVAGGKPVWVTEFGCTSGSDSDISTFLETVMPWMDSQDFVERYAYFMVSDGLLVSDGATTSYGSTYMSYTA